LLSNHALLSNMTRDRMVSAEFDASPQHRPVAAAQESADDLLLRVSVGDRAAFTVLYESFGGRVYGLAHRVVRDASQAEEVAQEIFLDIWRRASRFNPSRGSATSWIMTITHRRSVDRVRQSEAARVRDQKASVGSFDRDVDSVAEAVVHNSELTEVRDCLDDLTPLQRESIVLAYFGANTQREVGELLGVSLPSIKTRLRDGLIRLRDCMGVIV